MSRPGLTGAGAAVVITAALSGASAHPTHTGAPPPRLGAAPGGAAAPIWTGPDRDGVTFGFDGGAGVMSIECLDGCAGALDPSGSLAAHVGVMMGPRAAVLYDGWAAAHVSDTVFGSAFVLQSVHLGAMQGWVTPQVWLRGGVGLSYLRVRVEDVGTRSDTAPAIGGAVGFEALHRPCLSLDIVLRGAISLYGGKEGQDEEVRQIALGAGLSWY